MEWKFNHIPGSSEYKRREMLKQVEYHILFAAPLAAKPYCALFLKVTDDNPVHMNCWASPNFLHGVAFLCGFDTPSLPAQGDHRRSSYFNIRRGNLLTGTKSSGER